MPLKYKDQLNLFLKRNYNREISRRGYESWKMENEPRDTSPVDFGAWWEFPGNPLAGRWRVTWAPKTGILYALSMRDGLSMIILGKYPDRKTIDEAMHGWTDLNHDLTLLFAWLEQ